MFEFHIIEVDKEFNMPGQQRNTSRISIEVPIKIHKQLKTMAALNGLTVKDLVLSCLNEHLLSNNVPNEETIKAFKETDKGNGLITCEDAIDLFEKLGIDK